MARRREDEAPTPATPRLFTDVEKARIRRIIFDWEERRTHPHPGAEELRAIYIAAGRERPFRVWDLDPILTAEDYARAVAEELSDDDPDLWTPYKETWGDRYTREHPELGGPHG